jgi:hypothetical protein
MVVGDGAAIVGSDRTAVGDGNPAAGGGAPPHDARNSVKRRVQIEKRRI